MTPSPELAAALADWFGPDGPVIGSLIDGRLVPGDGAPIELIDPATEERLAAYPDGAAAAASAAIEAARTGGESWRALTASARGAVLFRIAEEVRRRAEPLARLESLTAGKPIRDCRAEVGKVAEMFAYYAGWADKLHGEVIPVPTSHLNYTRREPYGTVAQITPWNAPLFTAGWQVAPALATGNAVVLKPSELTPLTSLCLAKLAHDAGLPPGALNVLAGLGATAGDALVRDPEIGKVVFVGSQPTGRAIAVAAADRLTPCLLELGGKSAVIVCADADLNRAALGAQAAIFSAAGQSCTAGFRLLVQRAVHDELLALVAGGAERLRLGPPHDEATEIGPIQNARQHARIGALVATGPAEGAELVTGGGRPDDPRLGTRGYYFAPTVLAGVRPDMTLACEEVFGPVLAVTPFDDEDEAVALADATPYDLAGGVWTRGVARAHRVAARVRAGTLWINGGKALGVMSPFGGMRGSGYGRSSGTDALLEYTRPKSVWIETAADPAQPFGRLPD